MAKTQSVPNEPTAHEMTAHTRDYAHFVTIFKWGAILSFIAGFIVVVFILQ